MKSVVLYRRVSTDDQARGHSLDHQLMVLEAFCKVNNYKILADFREDYSAKTFDRPEWKKLTEYVKANKSIVDEVLMLRWDRYSRNVEAGLHEIGKFQKWGVVIQTVEQPLDLTIPDTKIMLSIFLTIPEIENTKNSIRTTEGMRKARLKGCWTGTAPFGYKNSRDSLQQSTLEINHEEAKIVTAIFHEMAKGIYTPEEVRRAFATKGIVFPKQTFLSLLRNHAYVGKVFIKAWKKEPEEYVQGLHEPIVDEITFNKVQHLLKKKKKKDSIYAVPNNARFPLKGSLVCTCGKNMIAYTCTGGSGTKHSYYECQKCSCRYKVSFLHEQFISFLQGLEVKDEVLKLYYEILQDTFEQEDLSRKKAVLSLNAKIEALDVRILTVENKYLDQEINDIDYKKFIHRLNIERGDLIMQVTELNMQKAPFNKYLDVAFQFLPNMSKYYSLADIDTQHKILDVIFPGKLKFVNGQFRTEKMNEVVSLIFNTDLGSRGYKRKLAGQKSSQSFKAPPSGLEPETP